MTYRPQSEKQGVHWNGSRWTAEIRICRRVICLGHFDQERDAIRAREEAEKRYERVKTFFEFKPRHREDFNPYRLISDEQFALNWDYYINRLRGKLTCPWDKLYDSDPEEAQDVEDAREAMKRLYRTSYPVR